MKVLEVSSGESCMNRAAGSKAGSERKRGLCRDHGTNVVKMTCHVQELIDMSA